MKENSNDKNPPNTKPLSKKHESNINPKLKNQYKKNLNKNKFKITRIQKFRNF